VTRDVNRINAAGDWYLVAIVPLCRDKRNVDSSSITSVFILVTNIYVVVWDIEIIPHTGFER
jgi:hypothetical protein